VSFVRFRAPLYHNRKCITSDMVQFYCEKTGGLKDTVIDFGDNGNGISHDQSSVGDICYSKGNQLV
jgi:hypothetical protein